MVCDPAQKASQIIGYAEAMMMADPTESAYHADPFHYDKGGATALVVKNAEAAGRHIPVDWTDIAEHDNPLWSKIVHKVGKAIPHGEKATQTLFDWTSQAKTVAKPIYGHIKQSIDAFDPQEHNSDVYREDVSNKAKAILKDVNQAHNEGTPYPYGVDEVNYHPTTHFLEAVADGYPYFEFNKETTESGWGHYAKKAAGNVAGNHMMLNGNTLIFHGALTVPRMVAEYPLDTFKALAKIVAKGPKQATSLLTGMATDPELEKLNVYSKNHPGSLTNYNKYQWSKKMLSFITPLQTATETMAGHIALEGKHPMNEVLSRVALQQDPMDMPSILVGKNDSVVQYGRYALSMDMWYLNLLKRATQLHTPEGQKALGTLATYATIKYYLFGSKSLVPGVTHPFVGYDEHEQKGDFEAADKAGGGNLVKQLTGLDLGEQAEDLNPWWSIGYLYKMLSENVKGIGHDVQKVTSDADATEKATSYVDMAELLSQLLPVGMPQEGVKLTRSYATALNDAAGNPGRVDYNQVLYEATKAQFGRKTANDRFPEYAPDEE